MRRIAELIGVLFALLHFDFVGTLCKSFQMRVYTGMLKTKFHRFGKSSAIYPYMENFRGGEYISIGQNTVLGPSIQLTAWDSYEGIKYNPVIKIGNNCQIRANSHITSINKIIIGDNLLTGTNVLITDNSHGLTDIKNLSIPPTNRLLYSKGPVQIGNNVWLGNNVVVLPGVTIGDAVVVGANSVVASDIPSYSVAVGAPAKILKSNRYE